MTQVLLTIQAKDESDLEDIERVIKPYYDIVRTGLYPNTREPFKNGIRAFYTLVKKEDIADE